MNLNNNLPDSWKLTTLDQVAYIEMGQSPDSRYYNAEGVGLSFFQGKAEFGARYPEVRKWCSEPTKIAEAGDILLSIRAPVGPTNIAKDRSCIGRGLAAIRAERGVNPLYLFYFFRHIESWLSEQGTGSTFAAISGQFVKQLKFAIAPSNEQNRIVEKLEELFSDLDAGVAELKAAQKKLTQYRQSLLKSAVEGTLSAEWRRKNTCTSNVSPTETTTLTHRPPLYERGERGNLSPNEIPLNPPFIKGDLKTSETGAQLLERILKERRARWEEKQLAKFQEQGKIPPKGWQDKYPEPVQPDTANLPELPEGWVWASVDQLSEVLLGKMLDKAKHQTGVKLSYLRNISIRWGNIETHDLPEMYFEEDELDRYGLVAGDVLVCEGGEPGRAAVCGKGHENLKYQKALHRVRLFSLYVPELLVFYLEHAAKSGMLERLFTGSTIKHFTKESFITLPIPLPSIEEQVIIVNQLKSAIQGAVEQSNAITYSLAQSAAQRKNILKSAFSGQLVPQDPNDEPASVLLERIRSERAAPHTMDKKASCRTKRKEGAHD